MFGLILKKLILKFVGYFDGRLFYFDISDSSVSLNKVSNNTVSFKKIMILSPEYYKEVVRIYPINNKSEVKKLIHIEYGPYSCINLKKVDGDKLKATIWTFDSIFNDCWFLLPETFLLSTFNSNGLINRFVCGEGGHSYFSIFHAGGFYLAKKSRYINTTEIFASSIGCSFIGEFQIENKAQILLEVFIKELKNLFKFKNFRFSLKVFQEQLIRCTLPLGLSIAVYFSVTSLYLFIESNSLKKQSVSLGLQVNEALSLKENVNINNEHQQILINAINQSQSLQHIWQALPELFDIVEFSAIRFESDRFFIRGQAEKTTTILDLLANNKLVKDVKLESPISSSGYGENFYISFTVIAADKE